MLVAFPNISSTAYRLLFSLSLRLERHPKISLIKSVYSIKDRNLSKTIIGKEVLATKTINSDLVGNSKEVRWRIRVKAGEFNKKEHVKIIKECLKL